MLNDLSFCFSFGSKAVSKLFNEAIPRLALPLLVCLEDRVRIPTVRLIRSSCNGPLISMTTTTTTTMSLCCPVVFVTRVYLINNSADLAEGLLFYQAGDYRKVLLLALLYLHYLSMA